ncbi:MAG: leucine-rich repeat domain-containing protein [Oscillospiraceae bacterium]|nr:leucine-rich repeat domain-containing protein [Oscillospiraceae bacterium]
MLKKIWSYKEQADGTLIITNYKGLTTKVTIPETIGKSTVTAIGNGAFAGAGAFTFLKSLEKIEIPEGVEEIGAFSFDGCDSLTEITVPDLVKRIGMYAFAGCDNLRRVRICEGVLEIGVKAFGNDLNLKEIIFPKSLHRLLTKKPRYQTVEALDFCSDLTAYCPKGSYAEGYCKAKGIKVEIARIYARLGELEYSSRTFGIACRFRGVECVRALVGRGANFFAPLTIIWCRRTEATATICRFCCSINFRSRPYRILSCPQYTSR